jgi:DNA-binding transcriptional LysR family regulator
VVPPDHRLADRERVFFDDIRDEPLLLREQGSGVRRKVLELFRLRALQPNIFLEAANIDFTKELIRKGAGIGLLGRMSVSRDLARGNLRAIPLESDELAIQIDVVLPKEGYRPLVTRTFVECLRHTPACGK